MAVVASNNFFADGVSVSFVLTAPNYIAVAGEARRRVTAAIKSEIQAANKRILRAAQKGYSFEPLHSSFKTIEGTSLKANEFVGGIATADKLFIPEEYGSGPAAGKPEYKPPLNRGAPGTGLEGYAERYNLNVYALQQAIYKKGTKPKLVVTPVFEYEKSVFATNLTNRINQSLAGAA